RDLLQYVGPVFRAVNDTIVRRQALAGRHLRDLEGEMSNPEAGPFERQSFRLDERGGVIPVDQKDVAGQVSEDISGIRKVEMGNEPEGLRLTVQLRCG